VEWGVGSVSEKVIDKINILEATKLAMKKAVEKINDKKAILLIDGNFKINMERKQQPVIRGDEKVLECSMASIIAKVERDRLMEKYHKKYPQYGFDSHKGYGTKKHFEAIKKYGLCDIHRKSFRTTH
jgi:ribonuclease HII